MERAIVKGPGKGKRADQPKETTPTDPRISRRPGTCNHFAERWSSQGLTNFSTTVDGSSASRASSNLQHWGLS
eukprot:5894394-Amphidinium_carterae.1